jgi:RNA polymerase sigma factor (sigma-70 family)
MNEVLVNDDRELLARYATAGDVGAFGELVRRYGGMVVGVARRVTGSVEDAEDVAQGVFLELARNCGRRVGSVRGYLHRAATTRALNVRREGATRRRHEMGVEVPKNGGEEEHAALIAGVGAAIAELSEEFREVLVMHYLEGRAQGEVAARLGMSQATVSRRLEAAVGELRRRLREMGMEVEGGRVAGMLGTVGPAAVGARLMGAMVKIGLSGAGSRRVTGTKGVMWMKVAVALSMSAAVGAIGIHIVEVGHADRAATAAVASVATTVPATAPATATAPTTGSVRRATGWTDDEQENCGRMRDIVQAIHSRIDRGSGPLPVDLGATLRDVQPWHEQSQTNRQRGDKRKKASMYLDLTENTNIPENPTPDWVNRNTSWVYLGSADVLLRNIASEDWGTTVLIHEKLGGKNLNKERIVMVFVDGHGELATPEEAKKMIEASKKILAKATEAGVP